MIAALLAWFLVGSAAPPPPGPMLAPGPEVLDEAVERLEQLLTRSDATGWALARVHNALGEALVGAKPSSCEPAMVSLALRSAPLGELHRDRVQSARVQLARTLEVAGAPTVAPVAGSILAERIGALTRRTRDAEQGLMETIAWHDKLVAPVVRRCGGELVAAPGPQGEALPGPVAVVVAAGFACPGANPGGGALLLDVPEACWWADASCACTPGPVSAGAVLGPTPDPPTPAAEPPR